MTSSVPSLKTASRTVSLLLGAILLAVPQCSVADNWQQDVKTVDCSRQASLAAAIAQAAPGDTLIIQGVCQGPITITVDQLPLDSLGSGAIDGGGHDVVTITTARQVHIARARPPAWRLWPCGEWGGAIDPDARHLLQQCRLWPARARQCVGDPRQE